MRAPAGYRHILLVATTMAAACAGRSGIPLRAADAAPAGSGASGTGGIRGTGGGPGADVAGGRGQGGIRADVTLGASGGNGGTQVALGTGGATSSTTTPGGDAGVASTDGASRAPTDAACQTGVLWDAISRGAGVIGYCNPVAILDNGSLIWGDAGSFRGYVVLDDTGRVVDNSGLVGEDKQAWLDGLSNQRWPCLAGYTIVYSCFSE